jgi:hypothetical protein
MAPWLGGSAVGGSLGVSGSGLDSLPGRVSLGGPGREETHVAGVETDSEVTRRAGV